jgi:hypothetical protein
MRDGLIVAPPEICAHADVDLAHRLMRRHLACRLDRCAWKAAAFHTLAESGKLVPQALAPRERAAARGIAFPPCECHQPAVGGPTVQTLREVLDALLDLASPEPGLDTRGSRAYRRWLG